MKNHLSERPELNKKQERFCALVAKGATPQEAHLAAGYSAKAVTSNPYGRLQKQEIRERIQELMDKSLRSIVRNDIALAKLKVHKGEHIFPTGEEIPPSLIEGAKNRVYDRSSVGPVIRQNRNENLNMNMSYDFTPEQVREIDEILREHYAGEGLTQRTETDGRAQGGG